MAQQPTVKEKPILFSGPMIRAILENRKSMTRRVIKPQPTGAHCCVLTSKGYALFFKGTTPESPSCDGPIPKCPYKVGQRLWVRETFCKNEVSQEPKVFYQADGYMAFPSLHKLKWIPSIFMPRWASRITLEVTGIRAERLQSISEEDAIAEGVYTNEQAIANLHLPPDTKLSGSCVDKYRIVWDSINKSKGFGWDTNPWVRVIGFRTITKG